MGKDQKTSEEIVSFISNFMDNNSDDLVFSIRRLIVYTETKSRNIEKMFAGMKLEYSEERQKVFSAVKSKKDNFFRMIRKNQLQNNGIRKQENQKTEKRIMNEIELSRMKETEFSVEVIDIAVARNKLYVRFRQALKKDIQDYEHRIAKNRISRLDYSGIITKYQKRLERNKIV